MEIPFRPLSHERTPRYREAVYVAIKEAILAGHFEPGQPLVEDQIAGALKVSRTPVREALSILEHENLIAPRRGRGLYVRELTRKEFVDMFVANEVVEPYLARRAALLADDAQLDEIGAVVERGRLCGEANDVSGSLHCGREFHRLVGLASGNEPLTRFVVGNEERTDLYLLSTRKVLDDSVMGASSREHEAILGAIRRRDPEEAARLVIFHSQSVRERFSTIFNDEEDREAYIA